MKKNHFSSETGALCTYNKLSKFYYNKWIIASLAFLLFMGCKKVVEETGLVGTCPVVVSTDPANGALNVPTNKKISATFNEAMDPLTINETTFVLKQGGNQVFGAVTYSGVTAVFSPASPLLANTVYTGTITGGSKDPAKNSLPLNYVWSFNTGSIPTVVSTDPINASIEVPLSKVVAITFSTTMDPTTINSNSLIVKNGTLVVPGAISYSGMIASFTPTTALLATTLYNITVNNSVKDVSGNAMAANYPFSFSTGALPIVVSTDPADLSINVVSNKTITAIFSKSMDATTINSNNFTLKQGANTILGTVTYSGRKASFVPAVPLSINTLYTGTISTGAKDSSGNALAANYVWSFTTGNAPTVITTDPADGSINVALNKTITAIFSKSMDATTININNFTLKQGANTIPGTVTYSGQKASFVPASPLVVNTLYTGTISTGAKDSSGNALAANYVWSFTTGNAPTVITTDPTDGSINVSVNKIITASFSTAMNAATITGTSFTIKQGTTLVAGAVSYSGTTASFNPSTALSLNTLYTGTITTLVKDLAGNAMASNYVWSFTTENTVAPSIVLGAASTMGAFGGNAGVTNQGLNTVINNGGIATTAASTLVTGFHDGITAAVYTETPLNVGNATGGIFTAPPAPGTATSFTTASNALLDATTAYNSISPASKPGGSDPGAGELGGLTLAPGVYKSASGTFKISNGNLTLDAKGDPNAVWIFQTAAGLTVGIAGPTGARSVLMINGGLAKNVFWYVGSSATINGAGGGIMTGTIIANSGVTFSTAGNAVQTVLNGRALSLVASVTMVNTTINVPN